MNKWTDFVLESPEDRARWARLKEDRPGCTLAGPGRGDCARFVGLPGLNVPGQHDGPDTEDHYGKPNGWCWSCWKDHQIAELQEKVRHMKDGKTTPYTPGPWNVVDDSLLPSAGLANAELMAAAPAMFECLAAINNEFVDPLEPWGPDLELPRDWLLGVREVLRKLPTNGKPMG